MSWAPPATAEPPGTHAAAFVLPGEPPPAGGRDAVGNKAWNLARMAAGGLPVPPAFVLPTPWCRDACAGRLDDDALRDALRAGIARLENATGLAFGSERRPLLVSVRSGAAVSMPGMLETVLDVGTTPLTVAGLLRHTGNPRLAWDSYRRLIAGFGTVVAGIPNETFDAAAREALRTAGVDSERDLDHRALRALAHAFEELYREQRGAPFPADPYAQLAQAARAVLASWNAPKAVHYRRLHAVSDDGGTAVIVQAMVFGNSGGASGAGVGFTRNPATGERELYLDFVFNGQGEDVVAGRQEVGGSERLRRTLPAAWEQLEATRHGLEALFRDAQDFEFTLERGRLYLLQTRRAQRTPWAALRIAVDLVEEGLISAPEALERLRALDLDGLSRARFVPPLPAPLAHAVVAGTGVATGAVALDAPAIGRLRRAGNRVVLVRPEIVTDDIAAIADADAILTAAGGRTSHAAVVARSLGKLCLVGCRSLRIDAVRRVARFGEHDVAEGAMLSLDGTDGAIYAGELPMEFERPLPELAAVTRWREATAG